MDMHPTNRDLSRLPSTTLLVATCSERCRTMLNSRLSPHLHMLGLTYSSWPGKSRPTGIISVASSLQFLRQPALSSLVVSP